MRPAFVEPHSAFCISGYHNTSIKSPLHNSAKSWKSDIRPPTYFQPPTQSWSISIKSNYASNISSILPNLMMFCLGEWTPCVHSSSHPSSLRIFFLGSYKVKNSFPFIFYFNRFFIWSIDLHVNCVLSNPSIDCILLITICLTITSLLVFLEP